MRILSSFALVALAVAPFAKAQAPAVETDTGSTCRVAMAAHAQGSGVTMWTTSLEDHLSLPSAEPKAGLHVVVRAREPKLELKSITLRVTYLPPGLRAIPTDSLKPGGREQSRTFELNAADGGALWLTGDLLLGRIAGVTRVAVERIAFRDGTEWTAPVENPCSVAPSGFVPVNAAR